MAELLGRLVMSVWRLFMNAKIKRMRTEAEREPAKRKGFEQMLVTALVLFVVTAVLAYGPGIVPLVLLVALGVAVLVALSNRRGGGPPP